MALTTAEKRAAKGAARYVGKSNGAYGTNWDIAYGWRTTRGRWVY